jgi:hypothetical protein
VSKKTKKVEYEVVGTHAVFGHEPGTTFSADLSAEQHKQLIDGGHLAVSGNNKEA